MGFRDTLKTWLDSLVVPPALTRVQNVAGLVPPDAHYVTAGQVALLADARQFIEQAARRANYRQAKSELSDRHALLVLAGNRLRVITASGEEWSVDVDHITDANATHNGGGFIILTKGAEGLGVGLQAPVQIPVGAPYRTVTGVSNAFSGWDEILSTLGVQCHW